MRQSCMFSLWSWVAGAVAACCCKVPLQGPAVRVLFVLWSLAAGAAGCRCKVLPELSECCLCFGAWLLVPLHGGGAKCCCQSAVVVL